LNLSGNQFSGEGFEHICQLRNLQSLHIDNFWDAFNLPHDILELSDRGDDLQTKLQFIRDALEEEEHLHAVR
jgi:Ran GTPase-activating protein (RanGAP) involved in mRNA processing and transport